MQGRFTDDAADLLAPRRPIGRTTVLRAHWLEVVLAAATTMAALVVLRLVGTQIYTEPGTIDPWLYTALMTNFDFTYHWFHATYYASRLPLIIPGLVLNWFLTPEQAYVVYHLAFFLGGGLFLYLLVRSLFGMRTALFVYPAFLTNAVYVDAHTWDYFDGVVITYLSGGLYFLVSSIGGTSRVRPVLAGFFFAAAAATNLFATLLVVGAIVAYLYGSAKAGGRRVLQTVALDGVLFCIGGATLLAACGWFAQAHGGRFLFFMSSIDAVKHIDTALWKLPTYGWMLGEPRLLVPLFVGAVAAVAWPRHQRTDRSVAGLAVTAAGAGLFVVLAIWEFTRSGTFLQVSYYFSTVYPFLLVGLATAVFALMERKRSGRDLPSTALAVLGLVAGAAPLVAIYGFNSNDLWGRTGSVITLVLMVVALAAAVSVRVVTGRSLAAFVALPAAVLVIASVNYASAANVSTYRSFETQNSSLSEADETFAMGAQLITLMQRAGFQDSLPAFWYDAKADPALTGMQSLYYWGYTWLNLQMPIIDEGFRSRLHELHPEHLILLCTEPTCRGGPEVLRRAGYRIRLVAAQRLLSRSKSVWVQAYALAEATAP